jgi:PD-(D/E)XK nuclease superfamily
MKLSYTNVSTFKGCPKRYYYKYIAHLPEPEGIELKVGTAGHEILEKYYNQSALRSQDFINELISEVQDEQVRSILMESLDGYHDWAAPQDSKITFQAVEEKFNYPIGNYVFTGKIDACGEIDGEPVLLEHKFKSQWSTDVAEQFQFDEQNKGYSLVTGCRQIIYNLIRTKPAKTRPKFERIHILVPESEIIRFENDLGLWNKKIQQAATTNEYPRNRGYMCKYCPFVATCYGLEITHE